MGIDLNNYEAYFLDYYEGKLGPAQIDELMAFLDEHPGLKDVFGEYEEISLTDLEEEFVSFEGKGDLKKSLLIDHNNYEKYFVASIENELNKYEQQQLGLFIAANPSLQRDLDLFKLTKLSPDLSVVYGDKDELKRGKRKGIFWYYAAAAAIALLIGLFFVFSKENTNGTPAVADNVKEKRSAVQPQKSNTSITIKDTVTAPVNPNIILPATERSKPAKKANDQQKESAPSKEKNPSDVKNELEQIQPPVARQDAARDSNSAIVIAPADNQAPIEDEVNIRYDEEEAVAMNNNDYNSLTDIALMKLRSGLLKDEAKLSDASGRFSGWDIVALGLKGFRKLTGRTTEMRKEFDDNGQVIAYGITAGNFQVSRNRARD